MLEGYRYMSKMTGHVICDDTKVTAYPITSAVGRANNSNSSLLLTASVL